MFGFMVGEIVVKVNKTPELSCSSLAKRYHESRPDNHIYLSSK